MMNSYTNPTSSILCTIFLCAFFLSCTQSAKEPENQTQLVEELGELSHPTNDSEEPYLYTDHKGLVYVSWLEKSEEQAVLRFTNLDSSGLQQPKTIATGSDWFVNWADYPVFSTFSDGSHLATFLQKSGPGTFAYDVKVAVANDVDNWSNPISIHDDGTQTEHGFVSLSPWGEDMLITWLDGRNTQGGHDHNHHGQMTLRAAKVDTAGKKIEEWELDHRVCDCCQTGSVITDRGPVVVYRDRSENETRDIGIVRYVEGKWLHPETVHFDNWKIAACPVNGPRIAAFENHVAVIWYSGAQEKPSVKIAFSDNYGEKFNAPIQIDLGKTIGRVNLAFLNKEVAFVTWMEAGKIWGRSIDINGKKCEAITLAELSEKRSSGFPQITRSGNFIYFAYTDDFMVPKRIKLSKIDIRKLTAYVE